MQPEARVQQQLPQLQAAVQCRANSKLLVHMRAVPLDACDT